MHGRISPGRACNPCGYTKKMSSKYHRLLIYDVKRTTKIDGMGPFKSTKYNIAFPWSMSLQVIAFIRGFAFSPTS